MFNYKTSFTLVQTDLGKCIKPIGVGYALFSIIKLWMAKSISSVVMPNFGKFYANFAHYPANLPAIFKFSIVYLSWIVLGPYNLLI